MDANGEGAQDCQAKMGAGLFNLHGRKGSGATLATPLARQLERAYSYRSSPPRL